ncbi:MAG: GNAT family N-acetyltransferase [Patescibacteria group bacterium]|nr:GNAT family N-acetyltransferase [Patescibacteria group bacterium]
MEKFKKTQIFFVAIDRNKIIGLIRGNPGKIVNLFVDGKYHHNGTGKKLMERFQAEAKKINSKEIKIKSSLYAVPFYKKMGFKKTTGMRNFHGLKIWPMRKKVG